MLKLRAWLRTAAVYFLLSNSGRFFNQNGAQLELGQRSPGLRYPSHLRLACRNGVEAESAFPPLHPNDAQPFEASD